MPWSETCTRSCLPSTRRSGGVGADRRFFLLRELRPFHEFRHVPIERCVHLLEAHAPAADRGDQAVHQGSESRRLELSPQLVGYQPWHHGSHQPVEVLVVLVAELATPDSGCDPREFRPRPFTLELLLVAG